MNEPIATHTVAEAMVWRNGFANGERAERERIIKLLEDRPNFCSSDDSWCFEWLETGDCDCRTVIALIKGENK